MSLTCVGVHGICSHWLSRRFHNIRQAQPKEGYGTESIFRNGSYSHKQQTRGTNVPVVLSEVPHPLKTLIAQLLVSTRHKMHYV